MPIEFKMLVWSAALALVQVLVFAALAQSKVGLPMLAGNREDMPPLTGMAARAQRAHANMIENLILFAILVLVAQASNHLTAATALGAQLFFWARLAYALIYIVGIPWLRTAAWAVSLAGIVLILKELLAL